MALRKISQKTEITDTIGKTKELIAIVKGENAKILCKDRANDWLFTIEEIDQYIAFLQATRETLRDQLAVELG